MRQRDYDKTICITQLGWCNDPVVEIKRCHDLGPATKYLYAIKELPVDQEFVVVDDDVIYSKFLVQDLVSNKTIDAPKTIRGLKFINIPTTLLSQVDSSIGGKTGVNNKYGKSLSINQKRLLKEYIENISNTDNMNRFIIKEVNV